MRAKIAQCLIAFSLIMSVGGHWVMLQSVAWFGMVIAYSQDAPLSVALGRTFDGKHPCGLCKLVQEGKKSEKKRDVLKIESKLDFWLVRASQLLFPPPPLAVRSGEPDPAQARSESPPKPPPRLA